MKQRIEVTPEQFSIICTDIVLGEAKGLSPDKATARAFKRAGVARPKVDAEIVVKARP